METDVAQTSRAEQCIANGMNEHIGIAVAQQPQRVFNLDAAQPKVTSFHQLVNVVTHADSYSERMILHHNEGILCSPPLGRGWGWVNYLLNKSLMPSMSNDRVKRNVWSRGLLFAVAMT